MKKMTELETMLAEGRAKLSAQRRAIAEREAAEAAYSNDLYAKRLAGIRALVPDFLHQHLTVENTDIVHIEIPGCARVSAKVYLHENYWDGKPCFEKAEFSPWKGTSSLWRLSRYEAYELEVAMYECPGELFDDLDVALARAVELGDGQAEAIAKIKAETDQLPAYASIAEQAAIDEAFKELDAARKKETLVEFFARWWRKA